MWLRTISNAFEGKFCDLKDLETDFAIFSKHFMSLLKRCHKISNGTNWATVQRCSKAKFENVDIKTHYQNQGRRNDGRAWGAVKEFWQWKLIWNKNRFINYVCFCSSATLTSQITTEIIETILNFLRALIAAINFSISILINRVITYDTWKNWFKRRRRPMILLWKGTSATQPFLLKDKGAMPRHAPIFRRPWSIVGPISKITAIFAWNVCKQLFSLMNLGKPRT